MTGFGGGIITTASFSYMVDGIIGIRVGGIRRGATLPMHTTLMTAQSTLTITCRRIR